LVKYCSICLVGDQSTDWEEVMEWGLTELKGKYMKGTLCKLAWGATVSHMEANK
jgi:hypothetical protein